MTSIFENPKFQNIIQYFLNNHCDMEAQIKALQNPLQQLLADVKMESTVKVEQNTGDNSINASTNGVENRKPVLPAFLSRPMRVLIADMIPTIMVSDGHNLIEAVFTK